jgi:hypothetical protein
MKNKNKGKNFINRTTGLPPDILFEPQAGIPSLWHKEVAIKRRLILYRCSNWERLIKIFVTRIKTAEKKNKSLLIRIGCLPFIRF